MKKIIIVVAVVFSAIVSYCGCGPTNELQRTKRIAEIRERYQKWKNSPEGKRKFAEIAAKIKSARAEKIKSLIRKSQERKVKKETKE